MRGGAALAANDLATAGPLRSRAPAGPVLELATPIHDPEGSEHHLRRMLIASYDWGAAGASFSRVAPVPRGARPRRRDPRCSTARGILIGGSWQSDATSSGPTSAARDGSSP